MFQLAALDRFAAHQRDRLGLIGDAGDGEAEVGLATLLIEIERNKPPADVVRDQRAARGKGQRETDQVAGEERSTPNSGSGMIADTPHRM